MHMLHLTLRFTEQPFGRLSNFDFERKFMNLKVNRNKDTIP